MKNEVKKNIKSKGPISILIHGGDELSFGIAKTLLEQRGKVIIVDHFNARSKRYITSLKELGNADFIDFKGLNQLLTNLPNIDYFFYFLNEYLSSKRSFSSKDFLEESNNLSNCLKTARDANAKFSLVTNIKLNQDLSAHILNSKLSAPSPYSPIELQKYCETLVAEYRDKSKINARIVRLGTVIGRGIEEINDETLIDLFDEFTSKTFLTIKGEGLDIHYLVNISDAIYGILKMTFADKTEGEVVSLANNHDYTTLSLAYKLLELNPDLLEIRFAPGDKTSAIYSENYVPAPNATEYGWTQKVTLEQSLIDTIATINPAKGAQFLKRPRFKEEALEKSSAKSTTAGKVTNFLFSPFVELFKRFFSLLKSLKSNFSFGKAIKLFAVVAVSFLLLYFIIYPTFGLGYGVARLYSLTKKSYEQISSLDFEKATKTLDRATNVAKKTERSFERIKWAFDLFRAGDMYDNSSQLIFASEYALSGARGMTSALIPLSEYLREFEPAIDFQNNTPTTSRDYRVYLRELEENASAVSKASYDIKLASELIKGLDVVKFPKFAQTYLADVKTTNENILGQVTPIEKILLFLPDILGVDERKTYLVLLQNPAELRSTGGWLSSYAIIGVDGGQIRELKVDDVYNADGQLRVAGKYFDAPKDMQSALGISRWNLSLSNWNPDLAQTASSAEYFLSVLDPGTEFDGVLTIDTELIKSLLRKWGEITVPGESAAITADNLDQKIFELHSKFTPGESIKATFLANLANETLERLLSSDLSGYQAVSSTIFECLSQKHIQVFLKNKEANDFFTQNKWAGQITRSDLSSPIPIEWNWGGNKANLYIERNSSLTVTVVDSDTIHYDYELFIQNRSTNNIYPQGNYDNYFRLILPSFAQITSVKGFTNNSFRTYNQGGYKIVGGWFNVPIRTTQSLEIKYKLVRDADTTYFPIVKNQKSYTMDLSMFKQAGTMSDIYDLSVNYPESWSANKHDGLERAVNTLSTRGNLDTPKSFLIIWDEK